MRHFLRIGCVAASALIAAACGRSSTPGEPTPIPGDGTLAFPQAIAGALWANPAVYETIPVHVSVKGTPTTLTVEYRDARADAIDEDGDGVWIADLPIGGLADGLDPLRAVADFGGNIVTSTVELGVGSAGVQLTDFDEWGRAGTPRVHRRGDELWVTWSDRFEPKGEVWMQKVDGAGRWLGERVRLVNSTNESLWARTAFGAETVAVLYQDLEDGSPYNTYFKVVDFDGLTRVGPLSLQPEGTYGAWGGAVAYDGTGFVATWRVSHGSGAGEVRFLRVDEATEDLVGPLVVAASGDDDPDGKFPIYGPLSIGSAGPQSLVGFVREHWSASLGMAVPKAQFVWVARDGTLRPPVAPGGLDSWLWDHEARAFATPQGAQLLWVDQDLTSSDPEPPTRFHLAVAGIGEAPLTSDMILTAPDERAEPFALVREDDAVLAWLDARSYDVDLNNGQIELYTGRLIADRAVIEQRVFSHARFVIGAGQLSAVEAGSNAMLFWLDQRSGAGIADPKPELWMETVWF